MRAVLALLLLAGCADARVSIGCRLALGDTTAVALVAVSLPVKGEAAVMCSRVDVAQIDEGDDD